MTNALDGSQLHGERSSAGLKVKVNIFSLTEAIDTTIARVLSGQGFTLFTINLDHLVKLRDDDRFLRVYSLADFVSADGWPVVWLLRRKGLLISRTTGADMVLPVCKRAAEAKLPVFLVGPMAETQRKAIQVLTDHAPGLHIAGTENSQITVDDSATLAALAAHINASGARICFVSLGAPKQELIAAQLRTLCPNVGFYCVGAALDYIAGTVMRAPGFMQLCGLEWLWRLSQEPSRLFVRYLRCAQIFLLLTVNKLPLVHL